MPSASASAVTRIQSNMRLVLDDERGSLDYVALNENHARDSRVKLPKWTREEPQPPTGEQLTAII